LLVRVPARHAYDVLRLQLSRVTRDPHRAEIEIQLEDVLVGDGSDIDVVIVAGDAAVALLDLDGNVDGPARHYLAERSVGIVPVREVRLALLGKIERLAGDGDESVDVGVVVVEGNVVVVAL